jgi:uncharacterized protein (TIGR03437 family)
VSAAQITAVVPFGVAGPSTDVLVLGDGQVSNTVTLPVAPSAPAIFSADGTGGDQGAILDEDGTPNGFGSPAVRGSIVSLYVTGLGQTNPAGVDGKLAGDGDIAVPQLSVSIFINGQPAEVVRAGLAPEMVQGIMQVQVRVPQEAVHGPNSIVIQAGDRSGPNVIFICVQ